MTFNQQILMWRIARFWNRVSIGKMSECWIFNRSKNSDGYGEHKSPLIYNEVKSHRIAFMLTFGHPEKPLILHRCDNPSCCNPNHLFQGTHRDNFNDMVSKNRSRVRSFYKLVDEFTNLNVSRDQKYRLRLKRDGLKKRNHCNNPEPCKLCGGTGKTLVVPVVVGRMSYYQNCRWCNRNGKRKPISVSHE